MWADKDAEIAALRRIVKQLVAIIRRLEAKR